MTVPAVSTAAPAPTATSASTGRLRTVRAGLSRALRSDPSMEVVDLWSIEDRDWRVRLEAGAQAGGPVVLLSSMGVRGAGDGYLEVLARREEEARSLVPAATVLRLAPLVDDLAVYDRPLREGQTLFHSYGSEPSAWLCAADVLAFVERLHAAPDRWGATFDLHGPEAATAEDVLTAWAGRRGVAARLAAVPVQVLRGHLGRTMGEPAAAAITGHQAWAGGGVAGGPRDALRAALGGSTHWTDAVARLVPDDPQRDLAPAAAG